MLKKKRKTKVLGSSMHGKFQTNFWDFIVITFYFKSPGTLI